MELKFSRRVFLKSAAAAALAVSAAGLTTGCTGGEAEKTYEVTLGEFKVRMAAASIERREKVGTDDVVPFDPDAAWSINPRVAVRPEPFGALLYHFGTRKLSFLKNLVVVDVVRSLHEHPSAAAALDAAAVPLPAGTKPSA